MKGPGKGKTNNPNGKPKGTLSQKTKAWEALGERLTGDHTEKVNKYLDELYKKDKAEFFKAYTLLLEYFKPKQARSEVDLSNKDRSLQNINIDLTKLSNQALKEIMDAYTNPPDQS